MTTGLAFGLGMAAGAVATLAVVSLSARIVIRRAATMFSEAAERQHAELERAAAARRAEYERQRSRAYMDASDDSPMVQVQWPETDDTVGFIN